MGRAEAGQPVPAERDQPHEVPYREVEHDVEGEPERQMGLVGEARFTLYERQVTEAERKRWRREDEERDRRRVPIGFRIPG